MIATDPLSLLFLGCAVFAGAFLIITSALGVGHTHGLHLGASDAHSVGHAAHVGHVGHAGVHATGHPAAHTSAESGNSSNNGNAGSNAAPPSSPLSSLANALQGSLNLYGLLVFLLIFGVLGYLLHNATDLDIVLSLVLAAGLGVLSAVVVSALLARLFMGQGGVELTSASSRVEGRLGQVSMAVRAGGIGEVIYTGAAGARQSIGARSVGGAPIPAGTDVVILSYRDGIATVQPWDAFMAEVRAGTAPVLEPIDLRS